MRTIYFEENPLVTIISNTKYNGVRYSGSIAKMDDGLYLNVKPFNGNQNSLNKTCCL